MDTMCDMLMFIGTYGNETDNTIQLVQWEPKSASLKLLDSINGVKNPSYLTLNQRQNALYAISEVEQGKVMSFNLQKGNSWIKKPDKQQGNCSHMDNQFQSHYNQNHSFLKLDCDKHGDPLNEGNGPQVEDSLQEIRYSKQRRGSSQEQAVNPCEKLDLEQKERFPEEPVFEGKRVIINQTSDQLCGNGPCYVLVDESNSHLFTVNYGDGSLSVYTLLSDNTIGALSDHIVHKTGSHPHAITQIPQTSKFIVTDLGLSCVYLYLLSEGKLHLQYNLVLSSQTGPRHIAISPNYRRVYVANEFQSTVTALCYNESITHLETVQEISTLPFENHQLEKRNPLSHKCALVPQESHAITNYGADIHLAAQKPFLYVSNRGHNSISVFLVQKSGDLSYVSNVSTKGTWPRNFVICPNDRHMFIANEHSDNVVVMEIEENGTPKYIGTEYVIPSPVCLKMFEIGG
ncbi:MULTISPECIES: beta-propeller fold lactonase family protein [Clostridia]|uniref:lactonase family protein n=1 Tax=Clostridia TaxID=186801 RepID=UPI000EA073D3|nr:MULTISPECIES: beta-propeller fold lactonase family protein [Clostridia]NBJ70834.1 hypothetical protein [Roseburia sp. 1XD42-34]RKI75697.1 hypothetical protein D7V87_15410 [Clostridium sp. 1xD42-85]